MTRLGEEDISLAGEFVLGLLDPAADAVATARISTDAEFANEVELWRLRFQPMVDGNDTPAPPSVWNTINAALPASTDQDVGSGSVRVWQMLTGLSMSAAVVLGILLLQQPASVPQSLPETPLIAALGSETGAASITARYDSGHGKMLLTPVSLDTGQLYPELWIIPAGGTPRSLGIVRGDAPSEISIATDVRSFIDEGGTLAITPEPKTGGPGGKPSGPVIASGKIISI